MSLEDIRSRIGEVRKRAEFFPKRRSDGELYALLSDCLSLCEDVQREGVLEALKAQYMAAPDALGRNRRYFESDADVCLVVGRLVFEGEKRRDAAWRYTATLRRASEEGIAGKDLGKWLASEGGINALFRSRAVKSRTSRTKALHLLSQVEVPKNRPFTITLQRASNGFFEVLDIEHFREAAE